VFIQFKRLINQSKYISICTDGLVDLRADKTMSPLMRHCQRALSEVCTHNSVRLIWVLGDSGLSGNETIDELAWGVLFNSLFGPDLTREDTRKNIRPRIKCWLFDQHMALRQDLNSTHRKARELIPGPSVTAKTTLLSLNP